jgi:hypothetical protein
VQDVGVVVTLQAGDKRRGLGSLIIDRTEAL